MNLIGDLVVVLKEFDSVEKIILFGSRNTNTFRKDSDYDICIILNNELQKKSIIRTIGKFMIDNYIVVHPYIYSNNEYL